MDPFRLSKEIYQINFTDSYSVYGYIYYAGLYTSDSTFIYILCGSLALIGVILNLGMILAHICSICYAQSYLYKIPYSEIFITKINKPTVKLSLLSKILQSIQNICCWPIHLILQSNFPFCHHSCHGDDFNKIISPITSSTCSSSTSLSSTTTTTTTKLSTPSSTLINVPNLISTPISSSSSTTMSPVTSLQSTNEKFINWPGVSILKPLSGMDVNLEMNLKSFFTLNYPVYELLFCVSDSNDPVCDLVINLINSNPHVNAQLVIAKNMFSINPKIRNLQAGYNLAQYPLLLISDSGIWMRPDTLLDLVITMESDDKIGLVHQVPYMKPFYIDSHLSSETQSNQIIMADENKNKLLTNSHFLPPTTDSRNCTYLPVSYEQPSFAWVAQFIFFSCWHAKIYLVAAFLDLTCVTGMSCLLRKSILFESGGFQKFRCYLAEDFFLSKHVQNQGWKIRLAHQPAWQNSPSSTLDQFHSRIKRWSQLRMSMVFFTFIFEPITRCLPSALIGAFSLAYFFPNFIDPGVYFLCYILLWFLLDYILMCQIYPPSTPFCITKLEYLMAWIFSEFTSILLHLSAVFTREVKWRDKRFRVNWGGLTERLDIPQDQLGNKKSNYFGFYVKDSLISLDV